MFNHLCIFDTFVIISLCQKAHECCICLTQHTRNTFPQENRRPGKKIIYELALTSFSIRVTGLGHIRVWTHCNAVLSSLPNNPGASRFWTLSPSLQIRVWSLLDDRQSCSFCRLDNRAAYYSYFSFFFEKSVLKTTEYLTQVHNYQSEQIVFYSNLLFTLDL